MLLGTYRSRPFETARLMVTYLHCSHQLTRGKSRGIFIRERQANCDCHKVKFVAITQLGVDLVH